MTDPESGWTEADVLINGQTLTFAESLVLRVAVGHLRISLSDDGYRAGVGEPLATNYDRALSLIEDKMRRRPS